jgi:hypothetical protein
MVVQITLESLSEFEANLGKYIDKIQNDTTEESQSSLFLRIIYQCFGDETKGNIAMLYENSTLMIAILEAYANFTNTSDFNIVGRDARSVVSMISKLLYLLDRLSSLAAYKALRKSCAGLRRHHHFLKASN